MTPEEEKSIIKKVIDGDKNAYESLVISNQKNVYNLALKMTRNPEDALDISQEVFIKAYNKLSGFRFVSKFSVWLYKMTYNMCIDFLRKSSGAKVISLDCEDDSGGTLAQTLPDLHELPEESAIRREMGRTIVESIDELPYMQREILVLREVTGMSYDDISRTLGVDSGTVKSRLSRARLKLTEILISKGTFPDSFRQKKREEVTPHE